MSRKREYKYGDILNRIDYYLKQADDWSSIGDLDDLITAASPKFFFKDVSARTISMFNVGGDYTDEYISKAFGWMEPMGGPAGSTAEEAMVAEREATLREKERNKTVEQLNRFTDELFPDETETSDATTEAGNAIANAITTDSSYLDYTKDDIFPTQGILLHDDNAGAIRIQRADPKDLSKGYNVYRNTASQAGGRYSKTTPWSDDERVQLNSEPIHNYHNAYKTATDSMSAISGKKVKPQVSLGLGAKISRQQRRNLVQKVEKKLESREKAVKKGVRDRTRQRWKDNAQQFLIELPQNAQNAAGEGIRKLGEKALEAADRLKEYEDMFTEQVGEKIREGVEKAKPEIRKALQAVRREAENQFFNAQVTWQSAKEFASEKASVIQGVLQQAKVKGSPIWNAATKKGGQLTDKVMYSAGVGLVRAQAATDAVSGFMGRMKSGFQAGYRAEMERQQGAQPSGELYDSNPQAYWEQRGELATKYAKGNAEFDREKGIADRLTDPQLANDAMTAAWDKWKGVRNEVDLAAADMGATLANIEGHVEKIKSGKGTVLPPAAGWPSSYGGASKVRSLQRNLKMAGLKPYGGASTGIPQEPTLRPVPEAPAEEAPAEGGEQLAFDPEAMAGEGQPQAEAAPEAAQAPAQPTSQQLKLPGMEGDEQLGLPGFGDAQGVQPVAAGEEATNGPGPTIAGKNGSGGAAASVPAKEREYATSAPYGLTLHTGDERGEGQVSTFYDKREARKAKAAKQQETIEGGGGIAAPGQAGWDTGKQQAGFTSGSTPGPRGQLNLAGENEMAEPIDDYKQAADEEESKAKRSQSKSKIRTARANARMAKARADEAEAKASKSEAESGAKIAHMLEKLDREIIELTAHANPKVSSVLSRLEKAIDSKSKVPATRK